MEDTRTNTQAQESTTQQAVGGTSGGEKTFTQEDVNRIVQERLARVKTDAAPDLQERERQLEQRSLYLDAREKLADAGLPKELLDALNCSSKESMEKSIKIIQGLMGRGGASQQSTRPVYRMTGGGASNSGTGHASSSNASDPASIRRAMGLKG
ncbi:MAG: hypothetical protein HFI38_03325 [Lachnospiraceae bacterium]|jgi:hypothetical protein|nr:hypothetical protein [Lachnospiraceae bacterium]